MSLTIHRLDPSIPVETLKGRAECLAWFDYGKEETLLWLCALDSDGSCWLVPNKDVRLCENYSVGREFKVSGDDEMAEFREWAQQKVKDLLKREKKKTHKGKPK